MASNHEEYSNDLTLENLKYSLQTYWGSLHKKIKFSIKDFFSRFDQICSFLQIWSHLLKKSLMGNFTFV